MTELDHLLHELTSHLREKHLKITTAESCTGGLVSSLLTELPGSSEWFERGFVTYSNLAKQEMLSVKQELIELHGAVSEEVARAMALGALHHSVAQLALSVTGIAGPDGGSNEKPVGTVCFAWAMQGVPIRSKRCQFGNISRQRIRHLACCQALKGMLAMVV